MGLAQPPHWSVPPQRSGWGPVRPRQVSGMQAQWPTTQAKFSFPVPLGQPQLTDEQPLLMVPQALPRALVGQVAPVQQAFGFADVLQVRPPVQPQLMVLPHPSLKVPQASPFAWPGPLGTLAQVYGVPEGQPQVPVAPGVVVEQTCPVAQPQLRVSFPKPSSSAVPHLFL